MANKKKSLRNVSELCNDLQRSMRATLGIGLEYDRLANFTHRILAAHKRELAERDGERKGILKANASFAADNTRLREEIAAKDEEIAQLKKSVCPVNAEGNCLNDELVKAKIDLAERNEIIKELADALDNYPCHWCKHGSDRCEWCDRMKEFDSLIAKAREVVK